MIRFHPYIYIYIYIYILYLFQRKDKDNNINNVYIPQSISAASKLILRG